MNSLRRRLFFATIGLFGILVGGTLAYAQTEPAFFTFGTSSTQPTVGKTFSVPVIIDTGNQNAAGADAVINYDPDALAVVRVEPGDIFDTYPSHTFDLSGRIQLSGAMAETTASFSGRGTFGNLTLRGNQAGSTTLSFACTAGSVNDSNILQAVTNVDVIDCGQTQPTTLLIAAGPTPTPTPGPAITPAPTASPAGGLAKTGAVEVSILLAGLGTLLLLGGFLKWNYQP